MIGLNQLLVMELDELKLMEKEKGLSISTFGFTEGSSYLFDSRLRFIVAL